MSCLLVWTGASQPWTSAERRLFLNYWQLVHRWGIMTADCHFKKQRCSRRSRLISSRGFMAAGWTLIRTTNTFSSCCHRGPSSRAGTDASSRCAASTCRNGTVISVWRVSSMLEKCFVDSELWWHPCHLYVGQIWHWICFVGFWGFESFSVVESSLWGVGCPLFQESSGSTENTDETFWPPAYQTPLWCRRQTWEDLWFNPVIIQGRGRPCSICTKAALSSVSSAYWDDHARLHGIRTLTLT